MIEVVVTASPLTNRRFTRNTQGAIYGYEQSLHHAYLDRIEHRSPIKGLYLASAWCTPGGGFMGALLAGQMAFKNIWEDFT